MSLQPDPEPDPDPDAANKEKILLMDRICRTCMRTLRDHEPAISINSSDIREKLLLCYPEMRIDNIVDPKMCSTCAAALSLSFRFRGMCTEADKTITTCIQNKTPEGGVINLNKEELLAAGQRTCSEIWADSNFIIAEEIEIGNVDCLEQLQLLRGETICNWDDLIASSRIEIDPEVVKRATSGYLEKSGNVTSADSKEKTGTELPKTPKANIKRNSASGKDVIEDQDGSTPLKVVVETAPAVDFLDKLRSPSVSRETSNKMHPTSLSNTTGHRSRSGKRSKRNKPRATFVHTTGEDDLMDELHTITTILEPAAKEMGTTQLLEAYSAEKEFLEKIELQRTTLSNTNEESNSNESTTSLTESTVKTVTNSPETPPKPKNQAPPPVTPVQPVQKLPEASNATKTKAALKMTFNVEEQKSENDMKMDKGLLSKVSPTVIKNKNQSKNVGVIVSKTASPVKEEVNKTTIQKNKSSPKLLNNSVAKKDQRKRASEQSEKIQTQSKNVSNNPKRVSKQSVKMQPQAKNVSSDNPKHVPEQTVAVKAQLKNTSNSPKKTSTKSEIVNKEIIPKLSPKQTKHQIDSFRGAKIETAEICQTDTLKQTNKTISNKPIDNKKPNVPTPTNTQPNNKNDENKITIEPKMEIFLPRLNSNVIIQFQKGTSSENKPLVAKTITNVKHTPTEEKPKEVIKPQVETQKLECEEPKIHTKTKPIENKQNSLIEKVEPERQTKKVKEEQNDVKIDVNNPKATSRPPKVKKENDSKIKVESEANMPSKNSKIKMESEVNTQSKNSKIKMESEVNTQSKNSKIKMESEVDSQIKNSKIKVESEINPQNKNSKIKMEKNEVNSQNKNTKIKVENRANSQSKNSKIKVENEINSQSKNSTLNEENEVNSQSKNSKIKGENDIKPQANTKMRKNKSTEKTPAKTPTKVVSDVAAAIEKLLQTPEYQVLLQLQAHANGASVAKSEVVTQKLQELETIVKKETKPKPFTRERRTKRKPPENDFTNAPPKKRPRVKSSKTCKNIFSIEADIHDDGIQNEDSNDNDRDENIHFTSTSASSPKTDRSASHSPVATSQTTINVTNALKHNVYKVEVSIEQQSSSKPARKKRGKKRVSYAIRAIKRRKQIKEAKLRGKIFYKRKEIDGRTTKKKQPPQTCDQCGKVFKYISHLNVHKRCHVFYKSFACELCGKEFALQRYLLIHTMLHFSAGDHQCTICNRYFSSCHTLKKHQRTHTGERPYSCEICDRTFTQRINLETHTRAHTGIRDFICYICNAAFGQKIHLVGHLRTHTGERPFLCDLCPKTYSKNNVLRYHKMLHAMKPYMCKTCHTLFRSPESLERHMRKYKDEIKDECSGRIYSCGICSRYFMSRYSKERHLKVHVKDIMN